MGKTDAGQSDSPSWNRIARRIASGWEKLRQYVDLPILIIVVLCVVYGVVFPHLLGTCLRFPDESEYLRLAQNLADYHSFTLDGVTPTAFRPPLYPGALALVLVAGGGIISVRCFQIILIGLIAFLSYHGFRRQGKTTTGVISATVLISYPVLVYASTTLFPQTLASFLLFVVVYIVLFGRPTPSQFFWAGIFYGLLALTVSSFLPLLVVFLASPAILNAKRPVLCSAKILLGVALVLLPWLIRNYVTFGEVVPISSNSGVNLLLGNSEHAGPNTGVNVDISDYTHAAPSDKEIPLDAYYRKMAVQWISGHPTQAALLYMRKILNYFNFQNELFTKSESSGWNDLLMIVTYYPLLLAGLARLFLANRYRLSRPEVLLYVVYFGNALFAAITFTRIRFRIPFDTLLIVGFSMFIGELIQNRFKQNSHAPRPSKITSY